jgi:hypothetical protein
MTIAEILLDIKRAPFFKILTSDESLSSPASDVKGDGPKRWSKKLAQLGRIFLVIVLLDI